MIDNDANLRRYFFFGDEGSAQQIALRTLSTPALEALWRVNFFCFAITNMENEDKPQDTFVDYQKAWLRVPYNAAFNFVAGIRHVSDNYWNVRLSNFFPASALGWVILMYSDHWTRTETGFRHLEWMVKGLTRVAQTVEYYSDITQTMRAEIAANAKRLLQLLVCQHLTLSPHVAQLALQILHSDFARQVIVFPLVEEIFHYYVVTSTERTLFGTVIHSNAKKTEGCINNQESLPLWKRHVELGISAWNVFKGVISSLCHGVFHVANHNAELQSLRLRPPSTPSYSFIQQCLHRCNIRQEVDEYQTIRSRAVRIVGIASYGSLDEFLGSLRVFQPLREKHGLMGSIGAHMAWNFYCHWCIPLGALHLVYLVQKHVLQQIPSESSSTVRSSDSDDDGHD